MRSHYIYLCVVVMALNVWPALTLADTVASRATLFPFQAVDTVKDSRDAARAELADPASFKAEIDQEMALIKQSGATHVALGTPYDAEFLPVLEMWVASARAHGLSVWFRGNLSGWEGWFGYSSMPAYQHTADIVSFVADNPHLFASGDIFSSCPECENGAAGDPRKTHDLSGYRSFMVDEYQRTAQAFKDIGVNVDVVDTMNYDVAMLVMDKPTTAAIGGVVGIDDYVSSADELSQHIKALEQSSGGKVLIGEFGAPIPDLNGSMTESQQADFVQSLLQTLYADQEGLVGVNYWTLHGGTTALLNDDYSAREVFSTLQNYYSAPRQTGTVHDNSGHTLSNIDLAVEGNNVATTDKNGDYVIFLPQGISSVTVFDPRDYYASTTIPVNASGTLAYQPILLPEKLDIWRGLKEFLEALLH